MSKKIKRKNIMKDDGERSPFCKQRLSLVFSIVSMMVYYAFSVQAEELSPGFNNPSGLRLFEITSFIVGVCLYVYFIWQSILARTLKFGLLLLISSTTMFWQEWYADWGAYLIYNPKFFLIPWGETLWTTPNKPGALIPLYGWYFVSVYMTMLWVIRRLRAKFPRLSHTTVVLIVAIPMFYAWDLLLEAFAVQVGWWSYVYYFGPAIISSKGNWPIIYPIGEFVVYGVIATWFLSNQTCEGRVKFESWFRVERIRNSTFREIARLGAWILVMNVLYLLFLIIPLVGVREIFIDMPSIYVP